AAEFLEELVKLRQRFGHDISVAVRIFGIVDFFDGQAVLVQVMRLKRVPQRLVHLEQNAEARGLLAAAIAEAFANLLIFLGRHGFKQSELFVHQPLGDVDTPEERDDAIDRKSTRLNSSHRTISYAVFCLKKKTKTKK